LLIKVEIEIVKEWLVFKYALVRSFFWSIQCLFFVFGPSNGFFFILFFLISKVIIFYSHCKEIFDTEMQASPVKILLTTVKYNKSIDKKKNKTRKNIFYLIFSPMTKLYKTNAKKLGNFLDTITIIKKANKRNGTKMCVKKKAKIVNIYVKDWLKNFVGTWDLARNLIRKEDWNISSANVVMYLVGELIKKEEKPS